MKDGTVDNVENCNSCVVLISALSRLMKVKGHDIVLYKII
jgi:hypothetical protein